MGRQAHQLERPEEGRGRVRKHESSFVAGTAEVREDRAAARAVDERQLADIEDEAIRRLGFGELAPELRRSCQVELANETKSAASREELDLERGGHRGGHRFRPRWAADGSIVGRTNHAWKAKLPSCIQHPWTSTSETQSAGESPRHAGEAGSRSASSRIDSVSRCAPSRTTRRESPSRIAISARSSPSATRDPDGSSRAGKIRVST